MRKLLISILFFYLPILLFSQEIEIPQQTQEAQPGTVSSFIQEELIESQVERIQLAISSEDYPVTPGDIYQINFSTGVDQISNLIFVESDYSINLGVFGKIEVSGMNFPQLKKRIEKIILEGYPQSLPSLTMISTGTFEVPVVGEIPRTRYLTAWGLSRLSSVVEGTLGRHSSMRDICVVSSRGEHRVYDLWRALYKGDLKQNPLIKPGDRIQISRVKKEIQVNGEIYRPGKYQLIEGESLQDFWDFSGGFTPLADINRITIERFSEEQARLILLDYDDYETDFEFLDRDIVTVPSKRDGNLQVTVVGAVFEPGRYTYTPPEKYLYYVNLAGGIDIERNSRNEVMIVDRYGNNRDPDLPIMPGDTINVLNNDFVYNYNRFFPVVTTGFAFIITIIEIINLAND